MRKPVAAWTALIVSAALLFFAAHPANLPAASRRGGDVQIFSLQILINQAYQMILEGASLILLDQMGKGGVFSGIIDQKGWTMMEQGERIILETLTGKEIQRLSAKGKGSSSLLSTVRNNGDQILKAVAEIRTYLESEAAEPALTRMHSLFALLNHGMKMATDGANLILLGRTGEPGETRNTLQRHGRAMMRDARVLIIRLADNRMMLELHRSGVTIDKSPAMASLNRSISLSMKIIDRLARM